jgi:hypothetical protein
MSGIFWLASYPKSGNTWFRVFLANLSRESDAPVDINQLKGAPIATAPWMFADAVGIEPSDLTFDEIDALRPDFYDHLASEAEEDLFIKVHDAFTTVNGRPMFGGPCILGAVYIVRNPLDVAVSLAAQIGRSLDTSIARLNSPTHTIYGESTELANQLRQRLLTWSEHVLSWVDSTSIRMHIMRYEDMTCRPEETFGAAVAFLGLTRDPEKIRIALNRSDLREMQRMEREHGFRERSPYATTFFGRGLIGGYRDVLTAQQIACIIEAHGPVMRRFGYLRDEG